MKNLKFDESIVKIVEESEKELENIFKKYDQNCFFSSAKIVEAFNKNRVSNVHFGEVTGYGYSDFGRETLEQVYSDVFKCEDALVRPQIMSGTHAIYLVLAGLTKHGDTLISISGEPYDSLKSIIGLEGKSNNSLIKNGVKFEQIDLKNNDFDIIAIQNRLKKSKVKMVEIQRSRGYSDRDSLCIEKIARVCKAIKQVDKDVIIFVDNCYGEFTEDKEPTEVGADIVAGSLMKTLGGGHARSGGYIIGRKDLVWEVSERFSAPCIGKDIGANLNQLYSYYKGLYMAPNTACAALKTMTLASLVLEKLGYKVSPRFNEHRTDTLQTVVLNNREKMINFCECCQKGTIVDNFVKPIASETPGYPHEEIMASGSFTTGSTAEFSCDGPLIPPYTVYMQGSLTYEYGKLSLLTAFSNLVRSKNF